MRRGGGRGRTCGNDRGLGKGRTWWKPWSPSRSTRPRGKSTSRQYERGAFASGVSLTAAHQHVQEISPRSCETAARSKPAAAPQWRWAE
eukprot:scaffold75950_cov56-Phaeocystis_antarctica.AAC.3